MDESGHVLELEAEAADPPQPTVVKEEADPAHLNVERGRTIAAFPTKHDKISQQQHNMPSNFHVLKNYDRIELCAPAYNPGTGCAPSTAFPNVKLPAGAPEPPLFHPVTDEILSKPPNQPPPPFSESTPAKNPVNVEEGVTVEPAAPPPSPLIETLG